MLITIQNYNNDELLFKNTPLTIIKMKRMGDSKDKCEQLTKRTSY